MRKYILPMIAFAGIIFTSCGSVHKLSDTKKSDSISVSVIDTVHVKKYDTSVVTHEISQYHTKTVELYDTVITAKDSIITVLKSRTIYTEGNANKTEIKAGTGIDSFANKGKVSTDMKKEEKTTEKTKSGGVSFWLFLIVFVGGGAAGYYLSSLLSPAKMIGTIEGAAKKII